MARCFVAIHLRHVNIQKDQVRLLSASAIDAFFSVVSFQDLMAESGQQIHHELQVRGVVFNYEYASRGTSSSAGIEMVNRLPFPYSLSKETRPPIMLASF